MFCVGYVFVSINSSSNLFSRFFYMEDRIMWKYILTYAKKDEYLWQCKSLHLFGIKVYSSKVLMTVPEKPTAEKSNNSSVSVPIPPG